ncbi:MAG: hypothetical protein GC205_01205 [Bacteroidetes bacterium]|nr:hypothetical protein [Bacteroidota bacterium]
MSILLRFTVLAGAVLFIQSGTYAQSRTANWIFGEGYHINYTDGEPEVLPFIDGFRSSEGAACISDTSGSLLFYSNTIRVWNANFQPLWNSDTLPAIASPPSSSKTNGSLFLPWPGDSSDRYFAFFQMNDLDNRLYCSKIDRTLDGGLGGILDEFKNVLVWDEPICEQLQAVKHGNGRDWWIIARKFPTPSDQITLVLLNQEGFQEREFQGAGFVGGGGGEFVASSDGSKIALATTNSCFPAPPTIAMYDFDRCSGQLTLVDTMLTRVCGNLCYGLAFSPSGKYLYYSTADKIALYQIGISDSRLYGTLLLRLGGPSFFLFRGGQLESNSNGEILFSFKREVLSAGIDGLSNHLAVIRHPELEGLSCYVDTFGIYLNGRENSTFSLPNFANYDLGPLVGSPCDTLSQQDTTQTGLHHSPLQNLSWSINPSISSGSFTVTGGPASWLIVHDLYGREVLRQWHEGSTPFDLTAKAAGFYLVYLRAADGTQTLPRKIVKQ